MTEQDVIRMATPILGTAWLAQMIDGLAMLLAWAKDAETTEKAIEAFLEVQRLSAEAAA
jgi:hypothetical protein